MRYQRFHNRSAWRILTFACFPGIVLTFTAINDKVRHFLTKETDYSRYDTKENVMLDMLRKLFTPKKPPENTKLGRNDLCWCGSGKKYKRCHLEQDAKKRSSQIADAAIHGRR